MKNKNILGLPFFISVASVVGISNIVNKGVTVSNVISSLITGVIVVLISNSLYKYYLKKRQQSHNSVNQNQQQ
jgi:hypothetical protein